MEYGERFVEKLRGMFAFAIWDAREGKLVLGSATAWALNRFICTGPAASLYLLLNLRLSLPPGSYPGSLILRDCVHFSSSAIFLRPGPPSAE